MLIWILVALASLIALVFLVGTFLPEDYHVRGHVDVSRSPQEVWSAIADHRNHPMSASMARGIEGLPAENGLPVWLEDIGSSTVRVSTIEESEPTHLVRVLEDQVVPMTARVEVRIEPRDRGARIHLENHTRIQSGTWHVPIFRVLVTITGGIRTGMKRWLASVGGPSPEFHLR